MPCLYVAVMAGLLAKHSSLTIEEDGLNNLPHASVVRPAQGEERREMRFQGIKMHQIPGKMQILLIPRRPDMDGHVENRCYVHSSYAVSFTASRDRRLCRPEHQAPTHKCFRPKSPTGTPPLSLSLSCPFQLFFVFVSLSLFPFFVPEELRALLFPFQKKGNCKERGEREGEGEEKRSLPWD